MSYTAGTRLLYVPSVTIHCTMSSLCRQPQLEKATWDLRAQLAAVARVLGRAALGVPGADAPGKLWAACALSYVLHSWQLQQLATPAMPPMLACRQHLAVCRLLSPVQRAPWR